MQPHKLHFWSLHPPPPAVAFGVLSLEPSHRQCPGDCPPHLVDRKDMFSLRREEDWCGPRLEYSLC